MTLRRQENVKGATAMMIAVGALSLMDACMKILSPHYSPMQIAAMRGLVALPVVIPWVWLTGGFGQLRRVRFPLHLLRGALGIMMLVTFAFALRALALSEAYAIFFVAPLIITALASPILGERVGKQRWIAISFGFAGALIVLRPTGAGALTIPGLSILLCALGYASSAITVRVLSRTDTTQSLVFWLMIFVAVGGTLLALPSWQPIQQPTHWLALGGIAVAGSIGQWGVTEAFRHGQASFVAPFEYTALVWGVSLDWTLWRTLPGPATFAGAAVIIASGVYLIRHERVHVEAEHP